MLSRRNLIFSSAGFCSYALLAEIQARPLSNRSLAARTWAARQDELARGLASGKITQIEWHRAVSSLAGEIDLESLAAELRRARVRTAGEPFGHDPQKRFVSFLDEAGDVVRLAYGVALFEFSANNVITPHAHKHMVSAHMVLDGTIRVRTYDRVRDEDGALLIRPSSDEMAEPGHSAAMTSARDNIHWFAPRSRSAMTIDVIVDGLDPEQERYLIQPLDPIGGKVLPDGNIRAPLISFERSMDIYTSVS